MAIVLIILAVLTIILISKGLIIVRQAEVVVIERLGTYHHTLASGLHLIVPIFDRPRNITWRSISADSRGRSIINQKTVSRIDLRETVYDFPRQNVITKDNVTININALLYFQVTDPYKAVYEIRNLPHAIEKLTQTTLRNVIGELELDATLSSRDTINSRLRNILDEATDKWGVKVNRVELQDIEPPEEIKQAMEKQMRAERDKRAKILEAEGEREYKTRTAEGSKQAAIREAEGKAQAKVLVAEAEKKGIKLIEEALSNSKIDPAQYQLMMRYIVAFNDIVQQGDKTVVIPYESSALMGSMKTLRELFNS
ncbi:MAG: SPFH domain-containing protein [Candidatus Zophobacter franzmannii]|nr:SPFH domain-containing protein [Candidatus Zophobacter franzmannii]